jgi:DNA-binding CsgD family transcriptional regulator
MRKRGATDGEAPDDQTVQGLYEASAGITPWRGALQAANRALGASVSKLVTADAKTKRAIGVEQAGDDASPAPESDAPRIDGHLERLWTHRVGEAVYAHGEAARPERGDAGSTWFIAAKVREHRCRLTFVSFARHAGRFTPAQFDRAACYVRHLATAMKVTQHCEDMKTEATVGHRLLHGSSRPMLLLGPGRKILAFNASARQLLDRANIVYAKCGTLECRLPANEITLAQVLDRFTQPSSRRSERRNRAAVKLVGTRGAPILCSVANMMPEDTSAGSDEHPVALLSFASLDVAEAQMDPAILASLYDFTPAELRLVASLLRGEHLVQIAARNVISLATVRSQLKSVFAKTNTHRQAEVIQLLLTAMLL